MLQEIHRWCYIWFEVNIKYDMNFIKKIDYFTEVIRWRNLKMRSFLFKRKLEQFILEWLRYTYIDEFLFNNNVVMDDLLIWVSQRDNMGIFIRCINQLFGGTANLLNKWWYTYTSIYLISKSDPQIKHLTVLKIRSFSIAFEKTVDDELFLVGNRRSKTNMFWISSGHDVVNWYVG